MGQGASQGPVVCVPDNKVHSVTYNEEGRGRYCCQNNTAKEHFLPTYELLSRCNVTCTIMFAASMSYFITILNGSQTSSDFVLCVRLWLEVLNVVRHIGCKTAVAIRRILFVTQWSTYSIDVTSELKYIYESTKIKLPSSLANWRYLPDTDFVQLMLYSSCFVENHMRFEILTNMVSYLLCCVINLNKSLYIVFDSIGRQISDDMNFLQSWEIVLNKS